MPSLAMEVRDGREVRSTCWRRSIRVVNVHPSVAVGDFNAWAVSPLPPRLRRSHKNSISEHRNGRGLGGIPGDRHLRHLPFPMPTAAASLSASQRTTPEKLLGERVPQSVRGWHNFSLPGGSALALGAHPAADANHNQLGGWTSSPVKFLKVSRFFTAPHIRLVDQERFLVHIPSYSPYSPPTPIKGISHVLAPSITTTPSPQQVFTRLSRPAQQCPLRRGV